MDDNLKRIEKLMERRMPIDAHTFHKNMTDFKNTMHDLNTLFDVISHVANYYCDTIYESQEYLERHKHDGSYRVVVECDDLERRLDNFEKLQPYLDEMVRRITGNISGEDYKQLTEDLYEFLLNLNGKSYYY